MNWRLPRHWTMRINCLLVRRQNRCATTQHEDMIIGANPDHLRALAKSLAGESDKLIQAICSLTSQLRGTEWLGRDAEAFGSDWDANLEPMTRRVAEAIKHAADDVTHQAEAQEQASSGGGASGGASGGSAWPSPGPAVPVEPSSSPAPAPQGGAAVGPSMTL